MQPFLLNSHDRIVFPSNFVPELDLSVVNSLDQLDSVIRRDFETKAPTGSDILRRVEEGAYSNRYELMRDVALNMFWVGRYAMTMYEKRPTRWRDVPRRRQRRVHADRGAMGGRGSQGCCSQERLRRAATRLGCRIRGPHLCHPLRRVRASQAPRH